MGKRSQPIHDRFGIIPMPAHYDDPDYSYQNYWPGREYEHQSEILAINRLLSNTKVTAAVDIGGGFGRLTPTLSHHAKQITLLEPSAKLRSQATKNLKTISALTIVAGTAEKTRLPTSSQNLVILIRVLHHLPNPTPALNEIHRILKPQGLLLLEIANSHNFKARIASWLSGQPILPIPIEKRSPANIKRQTIPFVNHSPFTIQKILHKTGFEIIKQLSVSNLRSPFFKKYIPIKSLITAESYLQPLLSKIYFGPSIFLLAKKVNP